MIVDIGAFVHQDYEISELEEFVSELEDWFDN